MNNALPISNAVPIPNAMPISNALPANVVPQAPVSYSYAAPAYQGCFPVHGCGEFILIVVLFILLIIVGAVCFY